MPKASSSKISKQAKQKDFYSMTGYGKGKAGSSSYTIDVEIRTLNNRFLDLNIKLPRVYSEIEMEAREIVSKSLRRGRVDLSVTRSFNTQNSSGIQFKPEIFNKLFQLYCKEAQKKSVLDNSFKQKAVVEILQRRDVLETTSVEEVVNVKKEKILLFAAIDQALASVLSMRKSEGKRLVDDIKERCFNLSKLAAKIKKEADSYSEKHRQRLLQRIQKVVSETDLESSRIEAEVALLVDRSDITEELVRIASHLQAFEAVLQSNQDGKKLEFLVQELGREFNTIGSKSSDANISGAVVDAKTEMERIREQVQNLE